MQCKKCGVEVILTGTKFCPECGIKIEPLPQTPKIEKIFTGVKSIRLNIGSHINIVPSATPETKINVEASEEVKSNLKIELSHGELVIDCLCSPANNKNIRGSGISIGGDYIGAVTIGRNNRFSVNNFNISDQEYSKVIINICTPVGVNVYIDTSGKLQCTVGDLQSEIRLKTSGSCEFHAICITDFYADTSGGLTAVIQSFAGGRCKLDTSGSCHLSVLFGKIKELTVDASGVTVLEVKAKTKEATLNVSGVLLGTLCADADNVCKDTSGVDNLTIVR